MDAQAVSIALIDTSAGYEAAPERVRLGTLADFSADVAALLRGAGKETDIDALDVAIVSGSHQPERSGPRASAALPHTACCCAIADWAAREGLTLDEARRRRRLAPVLG